MSDQKPRILLSYAYLSDRMLSILEERKEEFIFLLDSGAYSAYTRGREVDLGDYLETVNRITERGFDLSGYFTLDVIGNHEATRENYATIREAGFSPIPIFTRGAPDSDLEYYYEQSDLVAIGGIAFADLRATQYLKAIMDDKIRGRKVHWLGYSKKDFLCYYKPYQCDTSSFSSSVRFGHISMFINGNEFKLKRDNVRRWIGQAGVRSWISRYNLDPDRFRENQAWVNDGTYSEETCLLGYLSILSFCEYYYNLEKRGITLPYVAVTDERQALQVIKCYQKIIKLKGGQE